MKNATRSYQVDPELRQRAEELWRNSHSQDAFYDDTQSQQAHIRELEIGQIELQLQNADLKTHLGEAESALLLFTEQYEFAPLGYFLLDGDGIVHRSNPTGARMLGLDRSELQGKSLMDCFSVESKAVLKNYFAQLTARPGEAVTCEISLNQDQGQVRWFQLEGTRRPGLGPEGDCRLALMDISQYKATELSLRASEKKLKSIIESQTHFVTLVDMQGHYTYVNPKFEQEFGWMRGPYGMVGSNVMDTIMIYHHERVLAVVKRCVANPGQVIPVELDKPSLTGQIRTTLWEFVCLLDENGKPDEIQCMGVEITARKLAEMALRESEARAQAMYRAIPDMIFRMDRSGTFLDYKASRDDLYYQDSPSMVGLRNQDVTPPAFADLIQAKIHETLDTGLLQTFEYQLELPGKGLRDFEARMTPSGQVEVIVIVRDITHHKLADRRDRDHLEDVLLNNQLNGVANRSEGLEKITQILASNFRQMFDSLGSALYLPADEPDQWELCHLELTSEGSALRLAASGLAKQSVLGVQTSPALAEILSSSSGVLSRDGQPLWAAASSQDATQLDNHSLLCVALRSQERLVGLVEIINNSPLDEMALLRVQHICVGLTEIILRVQMAASLRRSEEKYRQLVEILEQRVRERTAEVRDLYENAPAGYHSLDDEGRVLMINQTELNWLGYSLEEVIGQNIKKFLSRVSRPGFDVGFAAFKRRGWTKDVAYEFVRKDGSVLPILVNDIAIYDDNYQFVMSRSTVFDNTERKAAQDVLQRAYLGLERALRMKDEFLANMSHELRTPLNSILGHSEFLLMGYRGQLNDYQKKYVQSIDSGGRHLLSLINDLLDIAKIESGKFEIHREVGSISDVCRSSLNFVRSQATKKSITIDYLPDPVVLSIDADQRRLKQILVNLLTNAVKFTPQGGHVELKVTPNAEERRIEFSVRDTGVGIEKSDLVRLFTPFSQVDSSLSRQSEGTGLGLALVKHLAEMHGGTVSVTSHVGNGSCFTVALPWEIDPLPDLDEIEIPEAGEKAPSISLPAPEPVRRGALQDIILLADDNLANRETLVDFLEFLGNKVLIATTGEEALQVLESVIPDLILMDVQMPGMDGLEATRRLRADERFAHIPVIAVTALAMPGDRERCLSAGANEYISKPVGLKNLEELIKNVLRRA